jgi:hypothetical protein
VWGHNGRLWIPSWGHSARLLGRCSKTFGFAQGGCVTSCIPQPPNCRRYSNGFWGAYPFWVSTPRKNELTRFMLWRHFLLNRRPFHRCLLSPSSPDHRNARETCCGSCTPPVEKRLQSASVWVRSGVRLQEKSIWSPPKRRKGLR